MLGVLYIALCMLCGYVICQFFFQQLQELTKTVDEKKHSICLPDYFVRLPAWYLTGTLFVSWMVYLVSYLFRNTEKPLFYGNLVVALVIVPLLLLTFFLKRRKQKQRTVGKAISSFFRGEETIYLFYAVIVIVFVSALMFKTFFVADGVMNVGFSVFSDFAPHLGMIRSFSVSDNFPTQYAHFAGEDIRYHFMFQFLAGNLEYLGMRIDFAFNLPSIFSMVSVYFLLFTLTVKLTKSKLCASIAAVLFTFRSSPTLFRYIAEQGKNAGKALLENTEFLGYTQNENWGLWNLNVYCNQRHLAFSLALLLLTVLLFLPYVEQMGQTIKETWEKQKNSSHKILPLLKEFFFTKKAFGVRNVRFAIGMGLVLGGIAFWNGSVLIATLAMLFFMAAVSVYRLDYLITAVIALVLSLLQTSFFIEGAAIQPTYYFGFLAANKTVPGVLVFIAELTGIVLVVALLGACLIRGIKKYMLFVFFVPFVLAFTLSLTVDITVNHKWIMISLMLISIFAAYLLTRLLIQKAWWKKAVAVVLLIVLTATGIYDYTIVLKRNQNYMRFAEDDPVTTWIAENATCEDLFLTPYYSLSNVVLGGAMLYYGWPYYSWSAGYDTTYRAYAVRNMYEASSSEELKHLVEEHGIRFIIVDYDCRTSTEYAVREDIIEQTYRVVFETNSDEWAVRIFDTKQEIN